MNFSAVLSKSPMATFKLLHVWEVIIQDYLKSLKSKMKLRRRRTSLTNDASELPDRGTQQGDHQTKNRRPSITHKIALWRLQRSSDA